MSLWKHRDAADFDVPLDFVLLRNRCMFSNWFLNRSLLLLPLRLFMVYCVAAQWMYNKNIYRSLSFGLPNLRRNLSLGGTENAMVEYW